MENKIVSITKGKEITFENGETKRKFSRLLREGNITDDEIEKILILLYEKRFDIENIYVEYNNLKILVDYYENPDKYFKITHSDIDDLDKRLVFIAKPSDTSKNNIIIHIHDDIVFKPEEYDKMENKIVSITKGNEITFENGETMILDDINEFNKFKRIKNNFKCELTSGNLTNDEIEKISLILYKNEYTPFIDTIIIHNDYEKLMEYYNNPDKYFKITHTDVISKDKRLVFIAKPFVEYNHTMKILIYIYNSIEFDIEEYNRFVKMKGGK